ncbi:MAG: hypothetical protein DMF63_01755 [Acidobacteria bacterium]|nr:MAG: hypothetical protein DMF63_01755 [Acidobacteriota bacterium]
MKLLCAVIFLSSLSIPAFAQSVDATPTPVEVVVTNSMPAVQKERPRVAPTPTPIIVGAPEKMAGPAADTNPQITTLSSAPISSSSTSASSSAHALSFGQMKSKIAEAKRYMQARPLATASTEGTVPTDFVRVAFQDWKNNRVDYFVLNKDAFLSVKDEKMVSSEMGRSLRVRTIRGNGVNTPIVIIDDAGETHLPLMVQYPVVREGRFMETAYYMSTHPGLGTQEVVSAGRYYVRNVIEIARERLKEKGIVIQPKIADIAERLATVEHVDHMRFRTELPQNIFNDIFTLYALNEGQTYRYSVSSAGAGGMVQMIPSTYRMVRSWHPNVPLIPDFVEGMRNHVNASEAMLLYMQRTWNDLVASPTVADAFSNGTASQDQLMAAGYNSNPAKIAGYINRGGQSWTSLIPRETKIYLQIYDALQKNVTMAPRSR